MGSAGWDDYYFKHPDAMGLEHLGKDYLGRPQIYSALGEADNIAPAGEAGSGRFDPRALKNSFEVSADTSADGSGAAVSGHEVHPATGVGYNSQVATSYKAAILVTTGRAENIDPRDIRYSTSHPDWVYRRGSKPRTGEPSHKDFVFDGGNW